MASPKKPTKPKTKAKASQKKLPSYFVGIGASAGGLEALQNFFSHMPTDSGMAFIVIQHLSPDYKSLMVELLSKSTDMLVRRVEDGVSIEANTIYLITPQKNMVIQDGKLFLSEQPQRPTLNLPIDLFLTSLAEDQGDHSIGVVLSGTGSDGTRGIRALKEQGGTVMVQQPASAKFDGMPNSAISTGLADFILAPEKMPEQLLNFINHPYIAARTQKGEGEYEEEGNNFHRLFALLNKRFSIDFTHYKPTTIIRRIQRRMGIRQVTELDDYLRLMRKDSEEIAALYKDLLIGVTKFFRDPETFQVLKEKVIPQLFEQALNRSQTELRVWVAGCSTGEEAYSLAMLLSEYQQTTDYSLPIKVFATDIDKKAIEIAGVGYYPESIVADVDVEYLSKYFEKRAPGYQVKRNIREMVVFAMQNLIKDPPFTKVDLISCRNLLIYLQPVLQQKVLSVFNYALQKEGHLLLGSSETIGDMGDKFNTLEAKHRIYQHTVEGTLPLKDEFLAPMVRDLGLPTEYRSMVVSKDYAPQRQTQTDAFYYQAIVKTVVDAAIVINQEREVVQSFGTVKDYLSVPEGPMSLDILSLLPKDLSMAASSGIHRVRKHGTRMTYKDIRVKDGEKIDLVDLTVDLLDDIRKEGHPSPLFLLQFKKTESVPVQKNSQPETEDELLNQRMNDLEQELQFTRENLQATIEELQTSNEELQATNEELLAANEELQSTNEELQSVNEELNTVNTEYQVKNSELTDLNSDIRNLMESTDIGTIFLDQDLCIRKFTPAVRKSINLLDQDIGRPLKDLAIAHMGQLVDEAASVLEKGLTVERIATVSGAWYLLKILPFLDEDGLISGVVITINQCAHNCPSVFAKPVELFERALNDSTIPQILLDDEGRVIAPNKACEKLLKVTREQLFGKFFYAPDFNLELDGKPLTREKAPYARWKGTPKPTKLLPLVFRSKGRRAVRFSAVAVPLIDSDNKVDGAILSFEATVS